MTYYNWNNGKNASYCDEKEADMETVKESIKDRLIHGSYIELNESELAVLNEKATTSTFFASLKENNIKYGRISWKQYYYIAKTMKTTILEKKITESQIIPTLADTTESPSKKTTQFQGVITEIRIMRFENTEAYFEHYRTSYVDTKLVIVKTKTQTVSFYYKGNTAIKVGDVIDFKAKIKSESPAGVRVNYVSAIRVIESVIPILMNQATSTESINLADKINGILL